MWFASGSTVIVSFFGYWVNNLVWDYMCFWCVCRVHLKHIWCILECCPMVDSWHGILLVCTFSCHRDVIFYLFFHLRYQMGLWFWCICFYFSKSHFGNVPNFGVTVKFWLLFGWKNYRVLDLFIGWSSSGYASTIGTLRGSGLVNGFDLGSFLIWFPSWFTSWSFFWSISLTGTLEGTTGVLYFLNIYARVLNNSLCQLPNLTRELAGDGLFSS